MMREHELIEPWCARSRAGCSRCLFKHACTGPVRPRKGTVIPPARLWVRPTFKLQSAKG
jgi:hypothetical protein